MRCQSRVNIITLHEYSSQVSGLDKYTMTLTLMTLLRWHGGFRKINSE
jgi:hypothetical protein